MCFWCVTQCTLVQRYQRFGETCYLQLLYSQNVGVSFSQMLVSIYQIIQRQMSTEVIVILKAVISHILLLFPVAVKLGLSQRKNKG